LTLFILVLDPLHVIIKNIQQYNYELLWNAIH